MNKYITLFLTFMKIGTFTFGGGYAMIPLITSETVMHRKWISENDILDIVAIAESTPGPIAVNAATFVGYRVGGVWGAFCATLGVVIPSFVIIYAISFVLQQFKDMKYVQYAFFGIRAGVLALLIKALISMYKQAPKSVVSYILMGLSFICTSVFEINAVIIILACAIVGILSAHFAKKEVGR